MTAPHVFKAINEVCYEVAKEGIGKNRKSEAGGGYKFRGIDDVYNTLAPIMAKAKLVIIPFVLSREVVERTSNKGAQLFYVTVQVRFEVYSAEDGSHVSACTVGEAMDSGDKATNKALSAAYKYMAFQLFAIPTEGDNDTENSTHSVAKPTDAEIVANWKRQIAAQTSYERLMDAANKKEFLSISHESKVEIARAIDERIAQLNTEKK